MNSIPSSPTSSSTHTPVHQRVSTAGSNQPFTSAAAGGGLAHITSAAAALLHRLSDSDTELESDVSLLQSHTRELRHYTSDVKPFQASASALPLSDRVSDQVSEGPAFGGFRATRDALKENPNAVPPIAYPPPIAFSASRYPFTATATAASGVIAEPVSEKRDWKNIALVVAAIAVFLSLGGIAIAMTFGLVGLGIYAAGVALIVGIAALILNVNCKGKPSDSEDDAAAMQMPSYAHGGGGGGGGGSASGVAAGGGGYPYASAAAYNPEDEAPASYRRSYGEDVPLEANGS